MTRYQLVIMQMEGLQFRALLEWTTGILWWRKTHRMEVMSTSGIVWERTGKWPGYVDGMRCDPPLEAVAGKMRRERLTSWEPPEGWREA